MTPINYRYGGEEMAAIRRNWKFIPAQSSGAWLIYKGCSDVERPLVASQGRNAYPRKHEATVSTLFPGGRSAQRPGLLVRSALAVKKDPFIRTRDNPSGRCSNSTAFMMVMEFAELRYASVDRQSREKARGCEEWRGGITGSQGCFKKATGGMLECRQCRHTQ